MFNLLYDRVSLMFSQRWPRKEGRITAVDIRTGRWAQIVIVYEFLVGNDGPYTGESGSPDWFNGTDVIRIHERLPIGKTVTIRYRTDNPTVNRLDPSVWHELEDWEF
jgi:hypothetical protein